MSSADMEDNDILDSHQHGLTQRKSYLTNLLELLEDWANTLDGRHKLDLIFFTSVMHLILSPQEIDQEVESIWHPRKTNELAVRVPCRKKAASSRRQVPWRTMGIGQ